LQSKDNKGVVMKKLLILLAMSLVTVGMAHASEIDLKKSSLKWKGSKFGGEHYGQIFYKSGNVKVEGDKITAGEFIVDMSSFTVEDLKDSPWGEKFLGHMKSADFFDVGKYPTSKLKVKGFKDGKVVADLTIRGKTNEIIFPVTKKGNTFTGKLTFNRTKFDMKYKSGLIGTAADKVIHDDVHLDFTVVLK
jgi:polyisoprenoid-binding protein YceI